MCGFMNLLVRQNTDLTVQERNLFSVAYKNVIGVRRSSWRIVQSEEVKHAADPEKIELFSSFRKLLEVELDQICTEVLELLNEFLLPKALAIADTTTEVDPAVVQSRVFYLKMVRIPPPLSLSLSRCCALFGLTQTLHMLTQPSGRRLLALPIRIQP